ncbi:MAG: sigma-70 family RNA polymerase sigma factor [Phycisphaerales bacterium]|nr:sigma-70 family RNA polymerase sigma factor [Phycisphaerales bacterium]
MPQKRRHPNKTARGRRKRRSMVQLERIEQALTEPVIVVESSLFKKKNAEELIFEIPTSIPRMPISWYCPAIDRATLPKRTGSMLLTREEEGVLFRQYNFARMKLSNLQDKISHEDNPKDEIIDELLRWYDIAIDSRDHIVERNLALVLAMAKRSWATGEYADLVAEGNVALLRSVDRFNCDLGYKFSTYACRALTTAFNRFGRKQIKHKDNVPFEFDPDREPVNKSEDETFITPEHVSAIREAVRSENAQLTPVEQDVLRYRFGLFAAQNPPKLTLEKAGNLLGISKERVRQVQIRALGKIREVLEHQLPIDSMVG